MYFQRGSYFEIERCVETQYLKRSIWINWISLHLINLHINENWQAWDLNKEKRNCYSFYAYSQDDSLSSNQWLQLRYYSEIWQKATPFHTVFQLIFILHRIKFMLQFKFIESARFIWSTLYIPYYDVLIFYYNRHGRLLNYASNECVCMCVWRWDVCI